MFDEQNKYGGLKTVFIKEEIAKCEDIEDLKEVEEIETSLKQ